MNQTPRSPMKDGFGSRLSLAAAAQPAMQPQMQQMPEDDEIDLGALLGTLWRGKLWILLCGFFALIAGGFYAFEMATPMYTASSTVAFESREEQVVDFESVIGGLGGDQASINTEVEVLRSRGLMGKLVDRLDLVNDPEFNGRLRPPPTLSVGQVVGFIRELLQGPQPEPPVPSDAVIRDAVIDAALGKVAISNVRQSFVFRITVTTEDPQKSALMANTLAETYIQDQLDVKFEATETASAWLSARVAELQVTLETSVEAVKDFASGSDLISPEALAALNRQLKELRDRRREADAAVRSAETRVITLQNARKDSPSGDDFVTMAALFGDLTLNRLLDQIQSGGGVAAERAFLARYDDLVARVDQGLTRDRLQVQALGTSVQDLDAQIKRQSADLVTLQQLERESEANRLLYEYFLNRLKETSVQQGIQQADSRVLSPAVVPGGPSAPRKSMILALSLMLGLMAGAGGVLARELAQNTFRTAEDLENATHVTVLGQIPKLPVGKRGDVLKYVVEKPTSAGVEAIRNLRTSTLLSNVDHPPQVIMSTSSIPGEGKTTQSITLAQNLSGLGKRVLLIEGDIRRRVFSEYFDLSQRRGLIAVLTGKATLEDVVAKDKALGFDILIGEQSKTNAADLFSSEAFKDVLHKARDLYEYIIIDTPPVLVVPDARVIGQSVDAILYSVKWDSTTKRQVSEGLKSFASVNLGVTGLVLSQIDPKGMKRYGYGDSYGAYGKYGRGYYDN